MLILEKISRTSLYIIKIRNLRLLISVVLTEVSYVTGFCFSLYATEKSMTTLMTYEIVKWTTAGLF